MLDKLNNIKLWGQLNDQLWAGLDKKQLVQKLDVQLGRSLNWQLNRQPGEQLYDQLYSQLNVALKTQLE